MRTTELYFLMFRQDPIFKLGISEDVYMRAISLGSHRFDFKSSYLIRANKKISIVTLERKLKHSFKEYRAESPLTQLLRHLG
jgi:hypothetical protein